MELDRNDSKGKFYRRKILHVGFNEDYNFFLLQKILLKELIKKLLAGIKYVPIGYPDYMKNSQNSKKNIV